MGDCEVIPDADLLHSEAISAPLGISVAEEVRAMYLDPLASATSTEENPSLLLNRPAAKSMVRWPSLGSSVPFEISKLTTSFASSAARSRLLNFWKIPLEVSVIMFSETTNNDRVLLKYEIVSMDSETITTKAVMYAASVNRSG